MSDVLIDTNCYCDAMRGLPDAVRIMRESDRILMSPIVIGELLAGFKGGRKEGANQTQLRKFLAQDRVEVVPISTRTAEFYAMIYNQLRKKGKPIPTNDLWIAASTMENAAHLASTDEHFRLIEGLMVV